MRLESCCPERASSAPLPLVCDQFDHSLFCCCSRCSNLSRSHPPLVRSAPRSRTTLRRVGRNPELAFTGTRLSKNQRRGQLISRIILRLNTARAHWLRRASRPSGQRQQAPRASCRQRGEQARISARLATVPRGATPRPETCGERSRDAAEPLHHPFFVSQVLSKRLLDDNPRLTVRRFSYRKIE